MSSKATQPIGQPEPPTHVSTSSTSLICTAFFRVDCAPAVS